MGDICVAALVPLSGADESCYEGDGSYFLTALEEEKGL